MDRALVFVDMAVEDLQTARQTGDEAKVREAEEKVQKAEEKVQKAEEKVKEAEEKVKDHTRGRTVAPNSPTCCVLRT